MAVSSSEEDSSDEVSDMFGDDVNNGMVPLSKVTGRVFAIIWPLKNFGSVPSQDPLNNG